MTFAYTESRCSRCGGAVLIDDETGASVHLDSPASNLCQRRLPEERLLHIADPDVIDERVAVERGVL